MMGGGAVLVLYFLLPLGQTRSASCSACMMDGCNPLVTICDN